MSKDIKKALEHCVEWKCDNCPNRDELGSGEVVCRGRLLPEVLKYVADLEAKLAESKKEIEYQESMKILAVKNQNQKAIEQLNQIINLFEPYENEEKDTILCANNGISFLEYIDQQIALLKGKVEYVKN